MVKFESATLDDTFAALSDPTRRALLARLGEAEGLTVSALAEPLPMSLPAVMKHLDVLCGAGLITRTKIGRSVICRLQAAPMEAAMNWLNCYQRFWNQRLDRLAAFLEEETCPPKPLPPSNRASPSSVVSMPRRKRSSPPGSTRKK